MSLISMFASGIGPYWRRSTEVHLNQRWGCRHIRLGATAHLLPVTGRDHRAWRW